MNALTIDQLNIFSKISLRIIKEQEIIIGPMAWEEAKKVPGLHIDASKEKVTFDGDEKEVLNKLVIQYERLFGKLSHAVSKEAVQDLLAELPKGEIPSTLQ